MGIYTLVTLTLECDHCASVIGQIITAKNDVPIYARAQMYCQPCIKGGEVGDLSTTTTKEVADYINEQVERAS